VPPREAVKIINAKTRRGGLTPRLGIIFDRKKQIKVVKYKSN
jgi:hypothetical protein